MDFSIAAILALDGLTNGAIYALLALATVLLFAVTRVIFIPQGEFVAYGALTMAALQAGQRSAVVWLLVGLCAASAAIDAFNKARSRLPAWARNNCSAINAQPLQQKARMDAPTGRRTTRKPASESPH